MLEPAAVVTFRLTNEGYWCFLCSVTVSGSLDAHAHLHGASSIRALSSGPSKWDPAVSERVPE